MTRKIQTEGKAPSPACGPPPPAASRPLERRPLTGTARELIEGSVSENTRRAYRAALARFDQWLDRHPVLGAAVTDAAMAEYLTQRFVEGKSPATCQQVVAALRFRAKL